MSEQSRQRFARLVELFLKEGNRPLTPEELAAAHARQEALAKLPPKETVTHLWIGMKPGRWKPPAEDKDNPPA